MVLPNDRLPTSCENQVSTDSKVLASKLCLQQYLHKNLGSRRLADWVISSPLIQDNPFTNQSLPHANCPSSTTNGTTSETSHFRRHSSYTCGNSILRDATHSHLSVDPKHSDSKANTTSALSLLQRILLVNGKHTGQGGNFVT